MMNKRIVAWIIAGIMILSVVLGLAVQVISLF